MKIDKLLKEYKISLFVFPADMWERSGFYFPDLRRICVNESLSKQEREKVILHELGHINHDPKHYKRLLLKYENQADRFMIHELLVDYLKTTDIYDFNWVRFATQYDISTTWGEAMIQDEFRKIQQSVI